MKIVIMFVAIVSAIAFVSVELIHAGQKRKRKEEKLAK